MSLSISLNYPGTSFSLSGCYNDTNTIEEMLTNAEVVGGDTGVELTRVTDNPNCAPHYPFFPPTREGILRALKTLRVAPTDKLVVLHYSGHGSSQRDTNYDEKDGKDECLVPLDVEKSGMITDDELNSLLVRRISRPTVLLTLFDCCHSGSMLDLRWLASLSEYDSKMVTWSTENSTATTDKIIVSISGCADPQTSADAWDDKKRMPAGAFTTALRDATDNGRVLRTKPILQIFRDCTEYMKRCGYSQRPKLNSSVKLFETDTLDSLSA
jgi:hypothetical protein